jgi:hypothetical protein
MAPQPLAFDTLPERIEDEAALEDLLSRPSQALCDDFAKLDGDIIVLGVAGKIGPTLAWIAKRAAPRKRIVGVARFTCLAVGQRIEFWDVETILCHLLDRKRVARLPKLPDVSYMAPFWRSGYSAIHW